MGAAARERWRLALPMGGAVIAALLVAGCRPDMVAWRSRLADPSIARLDGSWAIELRADSGEYGHEIERARTAGSLALVLNRERVTTSLFGDPPIAFGTYDVRLDILGIATGETSGTPDAWIDVRADSVTLTLSPAAKWPITLVGVWRGDSLLGRWHADQRAGPSGRGDFVLRRR